jgi:hypothetical protein
MASVLKLQNVQAVVYSLVSVCVWRRQRLGPVAGGVVCPIVSAQSAPPATLVCTVPPQQASVVPVAVLAPGGAGYASGQFKYT